MMDYKLGTAGLLIPGKWLLTVDFTLGALALSRFTVGFALLRAIWIVGHLVADCQ